MSVVPARAGEDAFTPIPDGARLPPVWAVPLIAVLTFVVAFLVLGVFTVAAVAAGVDVERVGGDWRAVAAAATVMIGTLCVLLVLWIRQAERRPLASAGWRGRAADLPWFIAGAAFAGLVVLAIASATGEASDLAALPRAAGSDPGALAAGALALALLLLPNSVAEELIFRGWALSVIGRRMGLWWAVGLTSAAFGAAHVPPWEWGDPARALSFVSYAFAGAAFAGLALRTGGLLAPIAFHTGFNALLLTGAYAEAGLDPAKLLEQFTTSPPLGTENVAEALVWLAVEVAFAAALLWWWRKGRTPGARPAEAGDGASPTARISHP